MNWPLYLSVLLWNTSGWDNAGTLAGEINNPQKTFVFCCFFVFLISRYPKALFLTLLLILSIYIWPLSVSVCVDKNYSQWILGHYADIAEQV